MKWRDLKYLIAYVAPVSAWIGFSLGGLWSPGSIYVAFGVIPLLELVLPVDSRNVEASEESSRKKRRLFDVLLWINVPVLYALLLVYLRQITSGHLSLGEQVAMMFNMGLIMGVTGINVGHELGHRTSFFERSLAWLLLLPALYVHFHIEHNRGHHKWVATDHDPASARKGEWVYTFWMRSIVGSWISAWNLESSRLQKEGRKEFSLHNQMIQIQILLFVYLMLIASGFGLVGVIAASGSGLIGILLLETINYIEHYGLRRKQDENGQYEQVRPWHSWNSDHELGRIFLYELTRHSDHHYRASRKYQLLRHFQMSPQLPFGYPGSMILSLVPPLWQRFIDPLIPDVSCPSESC
ncbi:MAG: alkane 1-monooxygenase [Saprospiraceae bacterium]|nr:alkane 1-monooxygenase [Saprospiraceae bacterium]